MGHPNLPSRARPHPRAQLGGQTSEAERSAKSDPKQGAEICWANYEISFRIVPQISCNKTRIAFTLTCHCDFKKYTVIFVRHFNC